MGKENWYVIQTLSAHESRIKLMCEECIHKDILKKCVMPVCEEKKRFNGKWHIREKRLFPGYLFLVTEQLELLQKELEKIESVTKLLGVGKDIVPLSEEEVCFIRQLTGDSDTVKMSEGIIEHDKVKVLCGEYNGKSLDGLWKFTKMWDYVSFLNGDNT